MGVWRKKILHIKEFVIGRTDILLGKLKGINRSLFCTGVWY